MSDVRTAAYDAVAVAYDAQFRHELAAKPLDRALLSAFAELTASGTLADVGCGPGHVTEFLARHHPAVLGVDLSPAMITIARARAPQLDFRVETMLDLSEGEGCWAGAVALYSIIHLDAAERRVAFRELARTIRSDGWLLIAFHVDSPDFASGEINHLRTWFGHEVELDGYFLAPDGVIVDLEDVGFTVVARMDRLPIPDVEYPSRRCYLLCQRRQRDHLWSGGAASAGAAFELSSTRS